MIYRCLSYLLVIGLSFAVLTSTALQPHHVQASMESSIGSAEIALSEQSGLRIQSIQTLRMLPGENKLYLTLTYTNRSVEILYLRDYWVYLQDKHGVRLPLRLLQEDKGKQRVAPYGEESLTYYADIGSGAAADFRLAAIRWDFTQEDDEQALGELPLPEEAALTVPAGSEGFVRSGEERWKLRVESMTSEAVPDGRYATVNVRVANMSGGTVDFSKLLLYLELQNGSLVALESTDSASYRANEERSIALSAFIPANTQLQAASLLIGRKSAEGLLVPLIRLETGTAQSVQVEDKSKTSRTFTVDRYQYMGQVNRVTTGTNDKQRLFRVDWQMVNPNAKPMRLPEMSFYLLTKSGKYYPSSAVVPADRLSPGKEKKDVLLFALPAGESAKEIKLLQYANAQELDIAKTPPLAVYSLPAAVEREVSAGQEVDMRIDARQRYAVTLDGMTIIPWGEKDRLTATVRIRNAERSPLPKPELKAIFVLGDHVRIPASIIPMDDRLMLEHNGTSLLAVAALIPAGSEVGDIQLILLPATSDTESDDSLAGVTLRYSADFVRLPMVAAQERKRIDIYGRSMAARVTRNAVYTGTKKQVLLVELEIGNTGKRSGRMPLLTGYMRSSEDVIYPLAIEELSGPVSPGGKALISAWSTLPKNVNAADLELVLGLAVTQDKLSASATETDGMLDAAMFALPGQEAGASSDLRRIAFFPYELSMTKLLASWGLATDTIQLKFDYELKKQLDAELYESWPAGHRLLLEFTDEQSGAKLEKALELESGTCTVLAEGSRSEVLTLSDSGLWEKIKSFDGYTVKLYDEFQGGRRLLASRGLEWFAQSDS